jgi:hypothetical protein
MQDETSISSKRAPQHRDDEDSQQDTLEAQQKPNKIAKVDEPNPSNSASETASVTLQPSGNDIKDINTTVEGGNEGDTDVRRGRTILSLGYLGEGYQGLQAYVHHHPRISSHRPRTNIFSKCSLLKKCECQDHRTRPL